MLKFSHRILLRARFDFNLRTNTPTMEDRLWKLSFKKSRAVSSVSEHVRADVGANISGQKLIESAAHASHQIETRSFVATRISATDACNNAFLLVKKASRQVFVPRDSRVPGHIAARSLRDPVTQIGRASLENSNRNVESVIWLT